MAFPIASSPDDLIRYNGTGRAYVADVGGSSYRDLGDLETFAITLNVSTDKMYSHRNAARSLILERESSREATLTFGLREQDNENLKMALLGDSLSTADQTAGHQDLTSTAVVSNSFVSLGKVDVFTTKLTHGTVTGTDFVIGEEVEGGTSGATGDVAWFVADSYVELVNVSGTFVAGETITGATGSGTAVLSGVSVNEDVVVVDAASPTTRYVNGTNYDLDVDYGLLRHLTGLTTPVFVAFDYPAVESKYFHALAASSVQKKLVFVTDGADSGPRQRITVYKARIILNGDLQGLGDGASILSCTGTVIADTTQPSGQEYFKIETFYG